MVTNVLVGPTFVAVTIAQPDQWETVLGSMLRVVAQEFTGVARESDSATPAGGAAAPADGAEPESVRAPRRLERAWAELGSLRAERPDDLARIVGATRDDEPARRQVAAALLADAPAEVARETWTTLAGDASRSVRRSTIDAVVDAAREELRPLLERALGDTDAWVRWKAVHGLAALGAEPSRNVIAARSGDPDFRVRLEAARAIG
jgi:HEAT repeat protein